MREAEVSITDGELAAMGIDDLFAIVSEAGLRSFEALACRGNGAVVQVEVATRCDEAALAGLDYVDQVNHVTERDDAHVYVISFTAPDLPDSLEATAAELVGTCNPDVDEDGATLSLVGPQETIAGHLADYEQAGVSPTLQRLGEYDSSDELLDSLTSRQREVIETAWAMGFYEVPKDVSATEIAMELELDSSTVNEHLQRAERNLLEQLF
ncbi:helix-turn-helix domain-containing protein [Haloarcula nitratireducens]|uniref:Helix-turn-helix domain-containing protein n=1 Tax=Haloarcula nitratireducens TaxID=2487749 RepID=A0AAW4PJ50_9EURY|nr:helix-turn-helix domain-containing protein [Halomicroarcula nitratireducens]MBX0298157.1 helix-turn-helix domain-containing protein [Halomicroarcula nitratireducens]